MTAAALLSAFLSMAAIVAVRYLVMAVVAYALLWRRAPRRAVRLNRRAPDRRQIRGEVALSLVSSAVYAAPAAAAMQAWKAGGTRLFSDLSPGVWPAVLLGAAACLLANDAFYFWAHRLMHARPMFRLLHAGHHRHPEPSPFAAFAFDPLEALLTGWLLPALCFVVPVEVHAALAVLMLTTVTGTLNHSGWEVWPRSWVEGPFGRWVITPSHHAQHHLRYGCNFGLYFQLWDRLCGLNRAATEHPAWPAGAALGGASVAGDPVGGSPVGSSVVGASVVGASARH